MDVTIKIDPDFYNHLRWLKLPANLFMFLVFVVVILFIIKLLQGLKV